MPVAAIRFHPLAAQEFWSALHWYQARSIRATQKFRAEFKRVAKRIAAAPYGTIHRKKYRWMRMHRFPYLVYYKVVDPASVVVFAVAHSRRRPGYWSRRTQP
jgi:plasmid stabilization system protein ParE